MSTRSNLFTLPLLLAIISTPVQRANSAEPERWRGAMVSPAATAEDIRALRRLGANHIRWQLTWGGFPQSPADNATSEEYDRWLESILAHVDRVLPVCEESGMQVCLDLHTPPGGRDSSYNCRLFQTANHQKHFVEVWKKMARRYKDKKAIVAFDLMNEPVCPDQPEPGCAGWAELALRAGYAIRAIDPGRTLVFEPAPWANPSAFDKLKPLPLSNVIYSFHFYYPMEFTHQGIHGRPGDIVYPGVINGKEWNQEAMRKAIARVVAFQEKHKTPIYVGEFSAARWAPNGNLWLRDALDIWEEMGWSWSYHAFREADVWSPEHDAIPTSKVRTPSPTERLLLLSSYFARNSKN